MIVANDLKWSEHVDRKVGKIKIRLCKKINFSLVRAYLDYAVQAWNPHLQGEIDKIETVQ